MYGGRLYMNKSKKLSPVQAVCGFGWAVQVLFELQLEGLANRTDNALCKVCTALQNMTCCKYKEEACLTQKHDYNC